MVAAVGAGLAGLALLVVVAVPLAIALAMTTQLAQRAVVLDGQSIGQAWSTGWRLERANPGSVLLTLLAQWLVMLVVGLLTFAVMAPFIFGPIVLLLGAGATPSFGTFAAAAVLLGIAWALGRRRGAGAPRGVEFGALDAVLSGGHGRPPGHAHTPRALPRAASAHGARPLSGGARGRRKEMTMRHRLTLTPCAIAGVVLLTLLAPSGPSARAAAGVDGVAGAFRPTTISMKGCASSAIR